MLACAHEHEHKRMWAPAHVRGACVCTHTHAHAQVVGSTEPPKVRELAAGVLRILASARYPPSSPPAAGPCAAGALLVRWSVRAFVRAAAVATSCAALSDFAVLYSVRSARRGEGDGPAPAVRCVHRCLSSNACPRHIAGAVVAAGVGCRVAQHAALCRVAPWRARRSGCCVSHTTPSPGRHHHGASAVLGQTWAG